MREKITQMIYTPSTIKLLDSTRLIAIVSILCILLSWSVTAMLDSQASRSILSFSRSKIGYVVWMHTSIYNRLMKIISPLWNISGSTHSITKHETKWNYGNIECDWFPVVAKLITIIKQSCSHYEICHTDHCSKILT